MRVGQEIFTIGHGRRPGAELVECLLEAEVETLVDVRRFPVSSRNPQFSQAALASTLTGAGIAYVHAEELGGRRGREPGEEDFACLGSFASYAARMRTAAWHAAFDEALAQPRPCVMCAETSWLRCHRRFISDFAVARSHQIVHLIRPGLREPHRLHPEAGLRDGRLYLCGILVNGV
jgi:uncharacterized protein (DUF488 family)